MYVKMTRVTYSSAPQSSVRIGYECNSCGGGGGDERGGGQKRITGWISYHYAIWVAAFVSREFSSGAETRRTDVNAVAGFANGVRAFDSDGVGEIATTAVAFDLKPGLCNGCCCLES